MIELLLIDGAVFAVPDGAATLRATPAAAATAPSRYRRPVTEDDGIDDTRHPDNLESSHRRQERNWRGKPAVLPPAP